MIIEDGRAAGAETNIGVAFRARSVVVTAGTFLRGLLHVGETSQPGGRMADSASDFSGALVELGFKVGRFKTGTPCRIMGRSIDFSICERQEGEDPRPKFSFWEGLEGNREDAPKTAVFHVEQLPCWITRTTEQTHSIIRDNLHRSPLYSGQIAGTGPRYCPSIEDKVVKFETKPSHQLFLEPEGCGTDEYYINGVSTSLPYDVQLSFIQTIPGLQRAEISRPGYAVEYDYFPATQLQPTMETKIVENLFFAGQINGTSGYEEAAAQGLIAGANAALKVQGRPPLIASRNMGYIGVMIDDLVTKGSDEPYRMFTSRAENRLNFRHDNADQRFCQLAIDHGLLPSAKVAQYSEKMRELQRFRDFVATNRVDGVLLSQLLKQPNFSRITLQSDIQSVATQEVWESITTDLRYEGYIQRQNSSTDRLRKTAHQKFPRDFDFSLVPGLRTEAREKLLHLRPDSLAQAQQIAGVTPADVSILSIWLAKK